MKVYDGCQQEVDEEDGYSDDDLDALPVDAFHELQQNAIRSTQPPEYHDKSAHPIGTPVQLPGPVGRIAVHGNLDNASKTSFARTYAQQPSSDYGDFDDEMLDGEIFDAAEEPAYITARKDVVVGSPIGGSTHREEVRQQCLDETSRLREHGWDRHPYGDSATSNLLQRHEARTDGFEDHAGAMLLAHEKAYEPHAQPTGKRTAVDELQAQIQEVPRLRYDIF